MDNTKPDYSNPSTIHKKSKLPAIIIVSVILIGLLSGGYFFLSRNKESKTQEVAGAATTAPTPTLPPTPTSIDKKSVKIQVLNGTATPGQAGKVASLLKNAGYNPDNIKTGNSSSTLTTSSIGSKSQFGSIAEDMKNVLSSDFPGIDISSSSLGTDSDYDIVITTGGKKYVAPTAIPTVSSTPTSTTSGTTDTPTPTTIPTTPTATPIPPTVTQ